MTVVAVLENQSISEKGGDDLEPIKYSFDPNDKFYMAPPMCNLIHYRYAALICGVIEVLSLLGGVFFFNSFHKNASFNSEWSTFIVFVIFVIAFITTSLMFYGILFEKENYLIFQIKFLHIEIFILLFGAAGSIASMCLGIEWTYFIFSPLVSISKMEQNFGPIWPFNVAVISFTGAAIGIWIEIIVQGCYDYLLDKKYFSSDHAPPPYIQMKASEQ